MLFRSSLVLDTATFYFEGHPHLELDNEIRPRGSIIYMSGFTPDRVTLVQGSWPNSENAAATPGTPVDVAVDGLGFELLGLKVGEVMDVFPAASFTDPPSMPVRISGVFERVDPEDEFWYETGSDFSLSNDRWTIIRPWSSVRVNSISRGLQAAIEPGEADEEAMARVQASRESRMGESFAPALVQALEDAKRLSEQGGERVEGCGSEGTGGGGWWRGRYVGC